MIRRYFRWNNSEAAKQPITELNTKNGGTKEDRATEIGQHGDEKRMITSWLSSVPPFLLFNFLLHGDPWSVRRELINRKRRGGLFMSLVWKPYAWTFFNAKRSA